MVGHRQRLAVFATVAVVAVIVLALDLDDHRSAGGLVLLLLTVAMIALYVSERHPGDPGDRDDVSIPAGSDAHKSESR